jgi:hypothetical protein
VGRIKPKRWWRQHQGDPYGEEEAVEDLQRDYLQKRYGHAVGDPNADSSKPKGRNA